jgi:hypothetical protein
LSSANSGKTLLKVQANPIAKRLGSWLAPNSLPRCVLLVAALIELLLCTDYHQQRWEALITRQALSPERAGQGLVIQWNGLGYYAWLRSLLIDGDWDFSNEFAEHNPLQHYVPPPQYRTPLGRPANQWSVGPACLWAVTVVRQRSTTASALAPLHQRARRPETSAPDASRRRL